MADIKKQRKAISDWLEFRLEPEKGEDINLTSPVIKLKMAPISPLAMLDVTEAETKGRFIAEAVLAAVEDWDLADKGEKIPVTADNKKAYLLPLLGAKVNGTLIPLGIELFNFANKEESFLKN